MSNTGNGALLTRVGCDPEYLYAITYLDAIRALTFLETYC